MFFLGRDFAARSISMKTIIGHVLFLFSKAGKFKTSLARVPYNKLLTNLARSFLYGPRFAQSVLPQPRPLFSSRPSRSVSKSLFFLQWAVFTFLET